MHAASLTRSLLRPLVYRHHRLLRLAASEGMKPIESLHLDDIIEKTQVGKSAVSGLFIGKVDLNVLTFPNVVCERREIEHLRSQKEMITEHFVSIVNKTDELQSMGFHDLNKLSATEVTTIFEGIGMAGNPDSSFASLKNLIHGIKYNKKIIDLINRNWKHEQDSTAKACAQLAMASYLMGRLKSHYKFCIETVDADQFIKSVVGCEQYHLYEMIRDIYKLESMCFYFAGMIDSFEGRDLVPDGMILKYSATDTAFRFMGLSSRLLGYRWCFGQEHDVLTMFSEYLGSPLMNRILLGMHGLSEYGAQYATEIERYRNDPSEADRIKKPAKLGLDRYLDRNFCAMTSPLLEEMVARLQLDTQQAYRKGIDSKESTAIYLADQAISIVQAICVLTRASRNIGWYIENFDADMILAEHETEILARKHKEGSYQTRRELMDEKMNELGGYYPSSPFLIFRKTGDVKQLPPGHENDPQQAKQLS